MFNRCDEIPLWSTSIWRSTLASDNHVRGHPQKTISLNRPVHDHVSSIAGRRPRVANDACYTTTSTMPARWRGSFARSRARDRRQSIVLTDVTGGRAGYGARQLLSSIFITVSASSATTAGPKLADARDRVRARAAGPPEILRSGERRAWRRVNVARPCRAVPAREGENSGVARLVARRGPNWHAPLPPSLSRPRTLLPPPSPPPSLPPPPLTMFVELLPPQCVLSGTPLGGEGGRRGIQRRGFRFSLFRSPPSPCHRWTRTDARVHPLLLRPPGIANGALSLRGFREGIFRDTCICPMTSYLVVQSFERKISYADTERLRKCTQR